VLRANWVRKKSKHCFFDFVGSSGTAGILDQAPFPVAVIKKLCEMNLGAYWQKILL